MKRFTASLALFLTGFQALASKNPVIPIDQQDIANNASDLDPVKLRPLNFESDNLFAAHRSHSSHASHASHRSGSGGGGGYSAPRPSPAPAAPLSNSPVDKGRAAPVTPSSATTTAEKLKLQVMRVQIELTTRGLYSGPIDGVLGPVTRDAITRFQTQKLLTPNGQMSTETLNALGIVSVQ